MNKKWSIILGPPGTGKTTNLLSIMETHMKAGIKPANMCFVSFTKKGAYEAKDRAMRNFKLRDDELPYFRTLHSLAFQLQGIDKRDVMGFTDYINICKLLGVTISSQQIQEDGSLSVVHTKGDRLFFLENLARATNRSLRDVWAEYPNDDLMLPELELLTETLAHYKKVRSKVDFTDMILKFNRHKFELKFDVFIVDEAQDLAPVQWEMVKKIANNSYWVYLAGDDDQAIYNWAGADAKEFIALSSSDHKVEVLHQSYRVPKKVHEVAIRTIKKLKLRTPKEYKPTEVEGSVQRHGSLETIDMREGTWLLLARNIFLLNEFAQHCMSRGYLFESRYGSPVSPNAAGAIKNWELLRRGEEITARHAKDIYEFMNVKTRVTFGAKKKLDAVPDEAMVTIHDLNQKFGLITQEVWNVALNKLKPVEINYFITALKAGEKMMKTPRIRINTIHGVKGGEADNVVLLTDMSRRTFEDYMKERDNELRVWYVGITRAKQNLHIMHPKTPFFIDL